MRRIGIVMGDRPPREESQGTYGKGGGEGPKTVFVPKKKKTTRWEYKLNDNFLLCSELGVKLVVEFEYAIGLKHPGL